MKGTQEQLPGRFITFEGIEGVGKTTNIQCAKAWLEERKIKVTLTREPGGTALAEALRQLLLQEWQEQVHPQTELMMLFAGRCQHAHEVIRPALARGEWVISDRFVDATYAYQGYGRGLSLTSIAQFEQLVLEGLTPDCTVVLDAAVEIGQERVISRNSGLDRIELEQAEFFQRVRHGYLQRAQAEPQRIKVIDANRPLVEVQQQLVAVLEGLLHNS